MALYSMTGYGSAEVKRRDLSVSVEMRSYNNRFLDLTFKLPPPYYSLESELSALVKEKLKRGKVDVAVRRVSLGRDSACLEFNSLLFDSYLECARSAVARAELDEARVVENFLPGLLLKNDIVGVVPAKVDAQEECKVVCKALGVALNRLVGMRRVEGKSLERELRSQLKDFSSLCRDISSRAVLEPKAFEERLKARLEKLAPDSEVDESRLATEIAYLADKADIREEVVRLRAHVGHFKRVIREGGGGRKLEFLLQEMLREINTTGSKTQSGEISRAVVDAKAVLEKMREQVQNLE